MGFGDIAGKNVKAALWMSREVKDCGFLERMNSSPVLLRCPGQILNGLLKVTATSPTLFRLVIIQELRPQAPPALPSAGFR